MIKSKDRIFDGFLYTHFLKLNYMQGDLRTIRNKNQRFANPPSTCKYSTSNDKMYTLLYPRLLQKDSKCLSNSERKDLLLKGNTATNGVVKYVLLMKQVGHTYSNRSDRPNKTNIYVQMVNQLNVIEWIMLHQNLRRIFLTQIYFSL